MTITEAPPAAAVGPEQDRALIERAAACGPTLAAHGARHDRDGTWVHESFEHIRGAGLLAIAVPTELGGEIALAAIEVCDLAMERTLVHAGRLALGMSTERPDEWGA